jgi:6-phosphogluconolactonase
MKLEVKVYSTPDEIALQVAEEIEILVKGNADFNRDTFLALSGGNTPEVLFKKLADDFTTRIDWKKLHLFWGDERCVPPGDDQSNYGMTKTYLLDRVGLPEENIHRIRGEDDPKREVVRIAGEVGRILPRKNDLPQFDLSLLGLGEDGHTASLFPGRKLKNISEGIAGIAVHPGSGQKRISLTLQVLNNTRQNIFMVTGERKAGIIYKIMSTKDPGKSFPAANIRAAEILKWYIDEDAAVEIKMP